MRVLEVLWGELMRELLDMRVPEVLWGELLDMRVPEVMCGVLPDMLFFCTLLDLVDLGGFRGFFFFLLEV